MRSPNYFYLRWGAIFSLAQYSTRISYRAKQEVDLMYTPCTVQPRGVHKQVLHMCMPLLRTGIQECKRMIRGHFRVIESEVQKIQLHLDLAPPTN